MPNYTGTSVKGLQLLGASQFPEDGTTVLDFTGQNRPDRLERVGTMLICRTNDATGTQRTIAVHKLYGHGILTNALPVVIKFSMPTNVWVNWFRAGLGWSCSTF